ncbi:hypothetical protein KJ865_00325, partial [Myxococcota bacterium]|nr:hypothetical protein [Myxococcota bacterium]
VPAMALVPDDVGPIIIYLAASDSPDPLTTCGAALLSRTPTPSCLVSFKYVFATPPEWENHNPSIESMSVDGVTVDATTTVYRHQTVHIGLTLDASDLAPLSWGEPGTPVTHSLGVAFYTDCGLMDYVESASLFDENPYVHHVTCTNPGDITQSWCEPVENILYFNTFNPCSLYAVVRDNMAGMAYHTIRFQ